jgi:hypothetical protein
LTTVGHAPGPRGQPTSESGRTPSGSGSSRSRPARSRRDSTNRFELRW